MHAAFVMGCTSVVASLAHSFVESASKTFGQKQVILVGA
jgi:hypothetical protein